uniref:Uncharacterized protein n=1 Tax=Tetranychus urticae TaxID=32264 RepID=T1K6N7_TETUR
MFAGGFSTLCLLHLRRIVKMTLHAENNRQPEILLQKLTRSSFAVKFCRMEF